MLDAFGKSMPSIPADQQFAEQLSAARAGDETAFSVVYRDLQPRLLRYATALVGSEAEDVTAEAWLQIARDIRGFVGDEDAFRGWAARIVRNRAIDHVRSRARRPQQTSDLSALLDRAGEHYTDETAGENLSTARAIALIATLPQDQAEAVLLRCVVGLDVAATALVLGKRPGAVRVAAHRGLKNLARRLEGGNGDE